MRFSITTMSFIVLLIAGYFPLSAALEPWEHSRLHSQFPEYAHYLEMASMQDGDDLESVANKIPNLEVVDRDSDIRKKLEVIATMSGTPFDGDTEFYLYNSNGVDGLLMFKGGKLINHHYEGVENPAVMTSKLGAPIPSLWYRLGILPYYVVLASILLALWVYLRNRATHNKSTPSGPTNINAANGSGERY